MPHYGLWLLAGATFLSCLTLPLPASILMMTAGGFVAAGDLVLWQPLAAAAAGGILGDQLGYWAGRGFGAPLLARAARDPARAKLLARADRVLHTGGMTAVFLTRCLFLPFRPWVNLGAGSARYPAAKFSAASALGEVVWAGQYVGMGYAFAGNIAAALDMLGSVLGLVAGAAGAAGAVILGLWLRAALRAETKSPP